MGPARKATNFARLKFAGIMQYKMPIPMLNNKEQSLLFKLLPAIALIQTTLARKWGTSRESAERRHEYEKEE
ncbi:MAG: hypothetical protein PVS3B3_24350 [Ktedonobacteraceae bacterium]